MGLIKFISDIKAEEQRRENVLEKQRQQTLDAADAVQKYREMQDARNYADTQEERKRLLLASGGESVTPRGQDDLSAVEGMNNQAMANIQPPSLSPTIPSGGTAAPAPASPSPAPPGGTPPLDVKKKLADIASLIQSSAPQGGQAPAPPSPIPSQPSSPPGISPALPGAPADVPQDGLTPDGYATSHPGVPPAPPMAPVPQGPPPQAPPVSFPPTAAQVVQNAFKKPEVGLPPTLPGQSDIPNTVRPMTPQSSKDGVYTYPTKSEIDAREEVPFTVTKGMADATGLKEGTVIPVPKEVIAKDMVVPYLKNLKPNGSSAMHVLPDGTVISLVTGADGQPAAKVLYKGDPKQETELTKLEIDGASHSVIVDKHTGAVVKDLGKSGEKPAGEPGSLSIQEDASGKPVVFNNKTGETKPVAGIQKAGTADKKAAATEKEIGPARDALQYAQDYVKNGAFTGSGDEALQEKFFELAKPTTGFRMTQPQMDMLQNSRSWMNSAEAHVRHAVSGTWFSDQQRKEIVDTMKNLATAKMAHIGGSSVTPAGARPPLSSFGGK